MIFTDTPLKDAKLVELEQRGDDRGFFARLWCKHEFEANGIRMSVAQINTSSSRKRGTMRGMHYQVEPHGEAKLMRCVRGSIYDVVVDLRPNSPTYKRWFGVKLTSANRAMLYVPEHFAHGYLALEDDAEVVYLVSEFYAPGYERGVRHDDPAFGIEWPIEVEIVSDKDRSWPDYREP
jgi:dTDP-4-dehydrorhamnose 3,5-epimerase